MSRRLLRLVLGDYADAPKIFRSALLDVSKSIQFRREAVAVSSSALSPQAAVRLDFGDAVGKKHAFVVLCGDWDSVVATKVRRVTETMHRIVDYE
jgi:hypothetical protein